MFCGCENLPPAATYNQSFWHHVKGATCSFVVAALIALLVVNMGSNYLPPFTTGEITTLVVFSAIGLAIFAKMIFHVRDAKSFYQKDHTESED